MLSLRIIGAGTMWPGNWIGPLIVGLTCLLTGVTAQAAMAVPTPKPAVSRSNIVSPEDFSRFDRALFAVRRQNWQAAQRVAESADAPLIAQIVQHHILTSPHSRPAFDTLTAFLRHHPGWPQEHILIRKAEMLLSEETPLQVRRNWFSAYPPITVEARLLAAITAEQTSQNSALTPVIRETWRTGGFGSRTERLILDNYGELLTQDDHIARVDGLLWRGQAAAVKRMFPFVSKQQQLLAQARLALHHRKPGVDHAVARVPAELSTDPGLVYDRVRWRRQHGRTEAALDLLRDHYTATDIDAAIQDRWWRERHILLRNALETKDYKTAYNLAAHHNFSAENSRRLLAEAEFLAGWVALRFLADPAAALRHFSTMYEAVSYPISLARGAYWSARAAEALGDWGAAARWYRLAERHPITFYGQLAAAKTGSVPDIAASAKITSGSRADAPHFSIPLAQATELLEEARQDASVRQYYASLIRGLTTAEAYQAATRFASRIGRPDLSLWAAKRASREGIFLLTESYPLISLPDEIGHLSEIEPALIFAVTRQESAFDTDAVSPAGARGLMQLMPGTARQVARKLDISYRPQWLIQDPAYNTLLGSSLLSEHVARYNGSYILALAAYNAGTHRVARWRREFGDPLDTETDIIDWLELIPFGETRNYVQRVLEALPFYRLQMGSSGRIFRIEEDLARGRQAAKEAPVPVPRPNRDS